MKLVKQSMLFLVLSVGFATPLWAVDGAKGKDAKSVSENKMSPSVMDAQVFSTEDTGVLASTEDIARLKKDLLNNELKVGITRLKDFLELYHQPAKKTDDEKKVILEYGDLKAEFVKKRLWKKWEYETSHPPAYTDKINLLRKKLSGDKIAGVNISIDKFIKDYDDPTEIELSANDGQFSYYYYGDIKLTFENTFTLKNWQAKDLSSSNSGVIKSKLVK